MSGVSCEGSATCKGFELSVEFVCFQGCTWYAPVLSVSLPRFGVCASRRVYNELLKEDEQITLNVLHPWRFIFSVGL